MAAWDGGWTPPGLIHGKGSYPLPGQEKLRHAQPHAPGKPVPETGLGSAGPSVQGSSFPEGEKDLSELLHYSEYVCFGSRLICIGLLI